MSIKKKVLLATFTNPIYHWLPYPVGCLISAAKKNPIVSQHYEFLTPLYESIDYPDTLFEDVEYLGLTNYVWNQGFNDKFAQQFKRVNPQGVVLYGGPNVPEDEGDQCQYLKDRPFVDVFFMGPGEESFTEFLLQRLDGKETHFKGSFGKEWKGTRLSRKEFQLHNPPTPYLDGIFDPILKTAGRLGMIIETNRGCPYKCSFCDWGSVTRSRIQKFDLEETLLSIRKTMAFDNVHRLYIADANFGIFKENLEIMKEIVKVKKEYGRHFYVDFCAAKNSSETLMEIIGLVHDEIEDHERKNYRISVQSHNPEVLAINDRSNIKLDKFYHLVNRAGKYRAASELIIGLPGETKESWLQNFSKEVDLKTGFTRAYKLQVLVNTPMSSKEFRKKHKIETRKFFIPINLVVQRLKEYHKNRNSSFEAFSYDDTFIEFETITSCFSYSLEDLEEMYSIWYWYSLLSNSRLAFDEMRLSKLSIPEQYYLFKENLEKMPLFKRVWSWHKRSFNEIFRNKEPVIRCVENANYIMKKPKYFAELFLNIDQCFSELSLLYPNIVKEGVFEIKQEEIHKLYTIDATIR